MSRTVMPSAGCRDHPPPFVCTLIWVEQFNYLKWHFLLTSAKMVIRIIGGLGLATRLRVIYRVKEVLWLVCVPVDQKLVFLELKVINIRRHWRNLCNSLKIPTMLIIWGGPALDMPSWQGNTFDCVKIVVKM